MAVVTATEKVRFIESVFGPGQLSRDGKNIDVRCPACAPVDRAKRKLSILVADDVGHCWTCGLRGNLWTFIRRFGSREELVEYRDKYMVERPGARRRCVIVDLPAQRVDLPMGFVALATALADGWGVASAMSYLAARGVDERDLWYYRMGIAPSTVLFGRIIVPSFDANGNVNYYVARAIDPRVRPRYVVPDLDSTAIVFNEVNVDWGSELVLCEGVFDLVKCPDNTVPLLGSNLNPASPLFNCIVANQTPVVLALDDDMLSIKVPRIARLLVSFGVSVRVARFPRGADPGSLSKAAVAAAIKDARAFEWRDSFLDRLASINA